MQTEVIVAGCNGYVSAIRVSDGEEIWRTKLWASVFGGSRGLDVSVIINGPAIIAGCSGRVFALNAIDGKILWENDLKGIGYNEVSLAAQGTSTQFITRVEQHTNNNTTTTN
ncbi:MAG TPA: PQQ-binding-like beta-propeller repeat protein [Chitinophagaceae bacterium]|nr:PQQ-binding-like beta-propeller repeat protein [Chitinophagaceae bacterium]